MTNYSINNYHSGKKSIKARVVRFLGISAVMISLGLAIVGADQIGHYMQTHRTGYTGN